jgi:transglutaminase-like putative cysteine protease
MPARVVEGLVRVDGRFYYHSWPEVRLREWVAFDPALGQFPADAAHLRFTVDGSPPTAALLRLIGTVQIEVLSETR